MRRASRSPEGSVANIVPITLEQRLEATSNTQDRFIIIYVTAQRVHYLTAHRLEFQTS